jgi:hypothetical protein
MGDGSQTIVTSAPYSAITTELDLGKGNKPTSQWKFEETPEGTKVSWAFQVDLGMNPVSRYMGFMIKNMIGSSYEKGLENLKIVCESMPVTPPATSEVVTTTIETTTTTTEEAKK